MSKNELSLNVYKMKNRQGCLKVKVAGKYYVVSKVLEPLGFIAWISQTVLAIGTGARQKDSYVLKTANGRECLFCCDFEQEVLLKLFHRDRQICSWLGSVRDFAYAVERLVRKLPKFL